MTEKRRAAAIGAVERLGHLARSYQQRALGGRVASMTHALSRRLCAEFICTFWRGLGGCGSAVLAAGYPTPGIGFAGVALAFGLTVLTMAFALGHVSGCH